MKRQMMTPCLIVVTGLPCTGKTSLGRWFSNELGWPFFFKDQFKEILFDHLDSPDYETKKNFGRASFAMLEEITSVLLKQGISHIIEANFSSPYASEYFTDLETTFNVRLCEIQLHCDGTILVERFLERSRSGKIHPGHQGEKYFKNVEAQMLRGESGYMTTNSKKFLYDTTNIESLDYTHVLGEVKKWIES